MLLLALLALLILFVAARASARCLLRKKQLPIESVRAVTAMLSGALFFVYTFAALVAYFLTVPQAIEALRDFVPQLGMVMSASSAEKSTPPAEIPHGKMPTEQNRAERLRLLEETEDLLYQETESQYQRFGQEHSYIVAEGISGTEDRYIAPRREQLAPLAPPVVPRVPQQSISVRELVASFDDISSIIQPQVVPNPAPIIPQAPAAPQLNPPLSDVQSPAPRLVYPAPMPTLALPQPQLPPAPLPRAQPRPEVALVQSRPPSPPAVPRARTGLDQQIQNQEQGGQARPAQQLSCDEIKGYMDSTDVSVFHSAITKPAGRVSHWKGPAGSYTVTAGRAEGNCRDYALQAELLGKTLRCQFSCGMSRPALPQRTDREIIRDAMNNSDQEIFLEALTYSGPYSWRSSSGIFYTISPVRLSNPCRDYDVQANIQGRVFRYLESNCE